ncbi:MAG TPA: glycine cleavage T C-terminal barrel domain-containing protein [Acidimicrobiales bacterium]|nr:glycine cleavage T C-terminal barrel domain-containing protein [Acidimicrobiales bacterium]
MSDSNADQRTLRQEVGAVWLERDFLSIAGPDSLKFLQGQLSQNVDMALGASVWSLLLQPQGKMVALIRVTRMADDEFILDTDGGWGEVVAERLNRFKIRVKATIDAKPWRCLALRGARAHEVRATTTTAALALEADWPGLPGVDMVGEDPEVSRATPLCSREAYEAVRIEAGIPMMGLELDERTIPAEAGIVDRTVSFTKGCYTGQELVARIDSRGGKVPRNLRGVVIDGDAVPPPGALLKFDGKDVGSLTSAAKSVVRAAPVALAYVGRAVEVPAELVVEWDGRSAPARVEPLPLVP